MVLKFIREGTEGETEHDFKVKDLEFTANISFETLDRNIKNASGRQDAVWLQEEKPHDRVAIIAAGGPSLSQELEYIRFCQKNGEVIFALNGVPKYLFEHGVIPDYHVLLDSLPWVADFVSPDLPMKRYYSCQCDPSVLDMAPDNTLWAPYMIGIEEGFPSLRPPYVQGGTTVGTRALYLAYMLGYRTFRLFGLDSSQAGDVCHAYSQIGYEEVLDVKCGDKTFKCPPQLMAQAEECQIVLNDLRDKGCDFTIYGNGLLRAIADEMNKQVLALAS